MGRRYRTKGSGQFGKKDGAWLNFWLLISTIFVLLFFVFARSNTITNPISAFISLIGLICLPISLFLFIVSVIGNTWDKGFPDISKGDKSKQNSIKFAEEESARSRAKLIEEAEERALKNKIILKKNKVEELEKKRKEEVYVKLRLDLCRNNPYVEIEIYNSEGNKVHLERLKKFGKSMYRGEMQYMGKRGGIYTLSPSGTRNYKF